MGVLEIFDWYPGDISWVSLRYFIGVLGIFVRFSGDIYLFPGYISYVSWR